MSEHSTGFQKMKQKLWVDLGGIQADREKLAMSNQTCNLPA
jgi:hypothetical protein